MKEREREIEGEKERDLPANEESRSREMSELQPVWLLLLSTSLHVLSTALSDSLPLYTPSQGTYVLEVVEREREREAKERMREREKEREREREREK